MTGKKVGLVAVCSALAMFVMGRVQSLAAHRGFAGSTAWAQSWDDADTDSQPGTLPDVSGSYSGNVTNSRVGNGTITAMITQGGASGGALSGTWSTDVGGGVTDAPLKGKVKPNSTVKLKLVVHRQCALIAHATFLGGDEIKGVYHTEGCGHPSNGTFDMFD